jgi:hypothetical protein
LGRQLREVLREYAAFRQHEGEKYRALKEAWIESVGRLIRQLEQWLRETDVDKVLEIVPTLFPIAEAKLGRYEAPGLIIRLDNREVTVRPGSRHGYGTTGNGVRVQGYVDLLSGGRSTDTLLRTEDQQGERWFFQSDDADPVPLTRESFEAAMARLLG